MKGMGKMPMKGMDKPPKGMSMPKGKMKMNHAVASKPELCGMGGMKGGK